MGGNTSSLAKADQQVCHLEHKLKELNKRFGKNHEQLNLIDGGERRNRSRLNEIQKKMAAKFEDIEYQKSKATLEGYDLISIKKK